MRPIPFVKSNSATTDQNTTNSTTTSDSSYTTNDTDLGIKVAGIYASIVSTTSTPSSTKAHHPSLKTMSTTQVDDTNSETPLPIYCESCDFYVRDPAHFHGTAHLVSTQSKPPQQQPQQNGKEQQQQQQKDQDPLTQQQQQQKSTTPTDITRLEMIHGKDRAIELMKKQGWHYGQGLGKTNQGAPYPVTTVWKHDRLGIGHPHTDRRRITHPSISKSKNTNSSTLKNPRLVNGKQLVANAKAEANLRAMMLHYMNH